MESDKFIVIKYAYRSRLLFRMEEEYRKLTGASFETIYDHRSDEDVIAHYYRVLNRECRNQSEESLLNMVSSYVQMSQIFRGEGIDWEERRQLTLRKKFCRLLFRKATAPICRLSVEEESKFKVKDCDSRLISTLFPNGFEEDWMTDLIFLILLTFGVIRPVNESRSRDMQDKDLKQQLENMINLVKLLYEDFPEVGSLRKPAIFELMLRDLQHKLDNFDDAAERAECSVAWFWHSLKILSVSCTSTASPQSLTDTGMRFNGFAMPGIWVDDADEGRTRFWIFPENNLMAFCYYEKSGVWSLRPYEFCIYGDNDEEFGSLAAFITIEGNRDILAGADGAIPPDQMVAMTYETGALNEHGFFDEISFECLMPKRPEWFDWNSYRRLQRDDPRYIRFREVLRDIYDLDTTVRFLFTNEGAFMTDSRDGLIAIDLDYLYVTAAPYRNRFHLRCDEEDMERYWYEPGGKERNQMYNLLNVEISEEAPLYLIPRFRNPDKLRGVSQRRFAEAARNTQLNHQVTVYRNARYPKGILCLNQFSIVLPLEESYLRDYGIRKLTSRRELQGGLGD